MGQPCARTCKASDFNEPDQLYDLRAGVEQMLAHEQAGGDGWWTGWEMLKAAYYAATPKVSGESARSKEGPDGQDS